MKTGNQIILDERRRQVEGEHWSADHDDRYHDDGALMKAAECYEVNAAAVMGTVRMGNPDWFDSTWPWDKEYWKPTTPLRDLTKAGALYLAEVDRLNRRIKGLEAVGDKAYEISKLKIEVEKADSYSERCAQNIDALRRTRWQKFKRWLRGGYEYGHTGRPHYRLIYRRAVRTGNVCYWAPRYWVGIHEDHWHKFITVSIPTRYVQCPECKGSPLILQCGKCAGTHRILQWINQEGK